MFKMINIWLSALFLLNFKIIESKVSIIGVEECPNDTDFPIKWSADIDKENLIVKNGELHSSIDLGKDQMVNVNVMYFNSEKNIWEFMANMREKVCKVLTVYLGEFGEEIQKAAGIEPKTCPVPKGDYKISNHVLNFSKFKFKDIPEAHLNVSIQIIDEMTNATVSCMNLEFSFSRNYLGLSD